MSKFQMIFCWLNDFRRSQIQNKKWVHIVVSTVFVFASPSDYIHRMQYFCILEMLSDYFHLDIVLQIIQLTNKWIELLFQFLILLENTFDNIYSFVNVIKYLILQVKIDILLLPPLDFSLNLHNNIACLFDIF